MQLLHSLHNVHIKHCKIRFRTLQEYHLWQLPNALQTTLQTNSYNIYTETGLNINSTIKTNKSITRNIWSLFVLNFQDNHHDLDNNLYDYSFIPIHSSFHKEHDVLKKKKKKNPQTNKNIHYTWHEFRDKHEGDRFPNTNSLCALLETAITNSIHSINM